MMLSSKDRKKVVGLILSKAPGSGLNNDLKRKNEEAMGKMGEAESGDDFGSALMSAASAFLDAVESKDASMVAQAFHEMFKACEVAPHDEYEHEEG